MTPAPERPDSEAARAQDEWDASLPDDDGLLKPTPAPERPGHCAECGEPWPCSGLYSDKKTPHRLNARPAAPVTDAGLREAEWTLLAEAWANVMDGRRIGEGLHAARIGRDTTTGVDWHAIAAEYAALSRQAEKETA